MQLMFRKKYITKSHVIYILARLLMISNVVLMMQSTGMQQNAKSHVTYCNSHFSEYKQMNNMI